MSALARDLRPLKPLVFQVLLALTEGERHGWSLVRELQQQTGGERVMPANFYRTLRGMLADGLIEEVGRRRADTAAAGVPGTPQERRRYFALTLVGQRAARAEARRLQELLTDSRAKRLLVKKP